MDGITSDCRKKSTRPEFSLKECTIKYLNSNIYKYSQQGEKKKEMYIAKASYKPKGLGHEVAWHSNKHIHSFKIKIIHSYCQMVCQQFSDAMFLWSSFLLLRLGLTCVSGLVHGNRQLEYVVHPLRVLGFLGLLTHNPLLHQEPEGFRRILPRATVPLRRHRRRGGLALHQSSINRKWNVWCKDYRIN